MVKTHKNFKSIVPEITNAEDIDYIISQDLIHKTSFRKKFPPHEKPSWSDEELDSFNIDLSTVDRVYGLFYVEGDFIDDGSRYVLIFRMNYYNKTVYVKMLLDHHWNTGYDEGTIFACLKPNTFFNMILTKNMNIEKILKFLADEDGIFLSDIYNKNINNTNNIKTLQSTCIDILYETSDQMCKGHVCNFVLPKRYASLLDDYNEYMQTFKYYH